MQSPQYQPPPTLQATPLPQDDPNTAVLAARAKADDLAAAGVTASMDTASIAARYGTSLALARAA